MSTTAPETPALESRVDQVLGEIALHHVDIPHPDLVRSYLARHADGLSLLVPVVMRARQEFPVPAQLSLEVNDDPETGERDLKLYVRVTSYEHGLWRRLLKVCDPFEEAFAQISSGWLHVTTDYRPPTT